MFIVSATMTAQFLFLLTVILKMGNSQYCGPPTPNLYQLPYNYYLPVPIAFTSPPSYVPPFPPIPFAPPIPGYSSSMFTSSTAAAPALNYPLTPYQPPSYPPPSNPPSRVPETRLPSKPTLPALFTAPETHKISNAPTPTYLTNPPTMPKYTPMTAAPRCNPPTAIAYYLTTATEKPKAAVLKENTKENLREKKLQPTYHCPFCTGFADVPKNSKVPPPPQSSSVLPGILDKIPTIKLPENLKVVDLSKIVLPVPSLIPDLLEKKLSGKLRFDEDVLDGFLTGLGFSKL